MNERITIHMFFNAERNFHVVYVIFEGHLIQWKIFNDHISALAEYQRLLMDIGKQ